jgi:hypothetical protein
MNEMNVVKINKRKDRPRARLAKASRALGAPNLKFKSKIQNAKIQNT